jgi:hypothetical protein
MTKGQEIANEWFNIGVPVGTDTKQQLAMTIDAAISEAVSQRTVECAKVATRVVLSCRNEMCGSVNDALQRSVSCSINALNTPAPVWPVWQHKGDCETQYQWDEKTSRWFFQSDGPACVYAADWWKACPSCGAPRPTAKGN